MRVNCILLLYTELPLEHLIRHKFQGKILPDQSKIINKLTKNWDKKNDQRSGTGLSQTRPRFFLFIVVVRDNFARITIIFLINPLAYLLNFSKENFGIENGSFWKTFLRRYWQWIPQNKIYNFKSCFVQLPSNLALRSAQWRVVLCLKG